MANDSGDRVNDAFVLIQITDLSGEIPPWTRKSHPVERESGKSAEAVVAKGLQETVGQGEGPNQRTRRKAVWG